MCGQASAAGLGVTCYRSPGLSLDYTSRLPHLPILACDYEGAAQTGEEPEIGQSPQVSVFPGSSSWTSLSSRISFLLVSHPG